MSERGDTCNQAIFSEPVLRCLCRNVPLDNLRDFAAHWLSPKATPCATGMPRHQAPSPSGVRSVSWVRHSLRLINGEAHFAPHQ